MPAILVDVELGDLSDDEILAELEARAKHPAFRAELAQLLYGKDIVLPPCREVYRIVDELRSPGANSAFVRVELAAWLMDRVVDENRAN